MVIYALFESDLGAPGAYEASFFRSDNLLRKAKYNHQSVQFFHKVGKKEHLVDPAYVEEYFRKQYPGSCLVLDGEKGYQCIVMKLAPEDK